MPAAVSRSPPAAAPAATRSRSASDRRRPVTDAGFDADGCGSAHAAGSAAVTLVRGPPMLDAARIGTTEIAAELGGLSPGKLHAAELAADALARALGEAVKARGAMLARAARRRRTLVAMSGGVDSAVAAHLCAADGRTAAVTLELWADRRTTPSAAAARRPRSRRRGRWPTRWGCPHFTIDLRDEFRAGVVEPFIAGYAGGETPNPCVGCNGHVRLDAMLELADRLGARDARDRPLRADRPSPATPRRAAAARRRRSRQGPDLHAGGARSRVAGADALPARRAAQAGGPRARGRGRAAGRVQGRLAGPVLPGRDRPGALPGPPRRDRRPARRARRPATAPSSATISASTASRSASGAGSAIQPRRAAVRARQGRRQRSGDGRAASSAGDRRGCRSARHGCTGPAPASTASSSATGHSRCARASPGDPEAGRHRELSLELDEPVDGAAPGQLACLMDGDLVVGWGTITRAAADRSPRHELGPSPRIHSGSDDLRRDPAHVP